MWAYGKHKTKKQGVNVLIPLSCVLCSEFRAFPVFFENGFSLPMHEFSWLKIFNDSETIFFGDLRSCALSISVS